jgi:hypothetical protein
MSYIFYDKVSRLSYQIVFACLFVKNKLDILVVHWYEFLVELNWGPRTCGKKTSYVCILLMPAPLQWTGGSPCWGHLQWLYTVQGYTYKGSSFFFQRCCPYKPISAEPLTNSSSTFNQSLQLHQSIIAARPINHCIFSNHTCNFFNQTIHLLLSSTAVPLINYHSQLVTTASYNYYTVAPPIIPCSSNQLVKLHQSITAP